MPETIAVIDVIVPATPVVDVRSVGVQGPPGEPGPAGPAGPAGPPGEGGGVHAATHAVTGSDPLTAVGASLTIGSQAAQSGALRLPNNQAIVARTVGDALDLPLIGTNTSNETLLGNATTAIVCQNAVLLGPQFLQFTERAPVALPATNEANLFLRDNGSGKSQLMIQFATGAAIAIATQA